MNPWEGRDAGTRRGVIGTVLAGMGILGAVAAALMPTRPVEQRGYTRVTSWTLPGGEGLFVAVPPSVMREDLRRLGERLRWEFRDRGTVVVMVFDDVRAAREVRRGSRVIGEARFQSAVAHQRATYLKDDARGEHSFTILVDPKEVIRY